MKKKLLILMTLLIIFSMSFAFTASKADELNTLKILKGDGTDYLLDQRLTRAQALTFVIRLIGKESFVNQRQEILRNTGFTDVPKDAWFTPYVGYGRGFKLVQGYGDGTFKPNAYLSEREFYAMVLNALKIDYTWGTVEAVAYENNLIESKDELNETNYLRSSVVEVLYKTLDEKKEMVDQLVASGIVSQDDVAGLKVYKTDELKTEIKSVVSNRKTETIVKFNEEISEIQFSIEGLTIVDFTINEDTVTIEHEATDSGENYTLEVKSVVDVEGFEVKDLSKTFIAFKDEPIESNYFMISDVEAVSKSQINVYFTHEVTIGAALPLFYDIYRDEDIYVEGGFSSISVAKMGTVDNGVSIWLKDDFLSGTTQYTLKVDEDLSSRLGVKIGEDAEYLFAGSSDENESLEIESFRVLNDEYIRIIYSQDVSNSAVDSDNYALENKTKNRTFSSALKATFTGINELKYRQVDVRFLGIDPDEAFELTIEDVEDKFGERKISEEVIPFSKYIAVDDLDIDAVVAKDQGTVLLYFNKPVASSNSFGGTIISNPSRSINAKYFDNNNPFLLTLILNENDQLSSSEEYDFQIVNPVSDLNGETNSGTLNTTFRGTSNEYPGVRFSDAYFVSDDHVYIRFNVPVSTSNPKTKFRLKYKDKDGDNQYENASSISFLNAYEAVVRFNGLSRSESYKIVADNVDDYSNQYKSDAIERSVGRE